MSLSQYAKSNGSLQFASIECNSLVSDGALECRGNAVVDGTLTVDAASLMNAPLTVAGAVECEQLGLGAGLSQIYSGNGVPGAGLGADGDMYLRKDPADANTVIYVKSGGAWTAK